MILWFHKLMNPHCAECRLEKECLNCDTLRQLLNEERHEKKQLLELIVAKATPVEETTAVYEEKKEVKTGYVPWRIRQKLLEENDRAKARIMNEQKLNTPFKEKRESEQIAEMEKELGIEEDAG